MRIDAVGLGLAYLKRARPAVQAITVVCDTLVILLATYLRVSIRLVRGCSGIRLWVEARWGCDKLSVGVCAKLLE